MEREAKTLKKIGLKLTPQRLAILRMMKADRTHPFAEKVYQEISKQFPGLSFATVYNTLARLVETGEIQQLDIDPDKKRFDPYTSLHYHFYCKSCGQVYDVESAVSLISAIKKIGGHRVDTVQLNFKGICKDCAKR